VKVSYRQAASDDLVRQFRYYLVTLDRPEIAIRFRRSVQLRVEELRQHPLVGPRYQTDNPALENMRSWPIAGFEAIRIYYVVGSGSLSIIRILHGKRDVKNLLAGEGQK
jgi:toxin ParE1/3/4